MRNHLILLKKGKKINLSRRGNKNIKQANKPSLYPKPINVPNDVGDFEVVGGSLYQKRSSQFLRASSTDVTEPNKIINSRLNRKPLRLML